MTTASYETASRNVEFLKAKKEIEDLKSARTRCWGAWLKCLSLGAIGSVWQSCVTGNWRPTGIATIVAVPCVFLAPVDMGLTVAFAPPITAAAMFTSAATKQRNRFHFVSPEQADMELMEKGIY